MILVDTSVWIDHLRAGDPELSSALKEGEVLIHPFVIGEIALGHLAKRNAILDLLDALPRARVASDDEVLAFVDRRRLMGRGVGYVDVHLLASAALTPPARFLTRDRRLARIAAELALG